MDTYLVYTGTNIHPCNIKYRVGSFRPIDKSRAITGWYIIHNLIPEHELFVSCTKDTVQIRDVATSKIVGSFRPETILDPINEILRRLSTLTITEEKYIDILNDRDAPVPYVRPPRSNTPKVKATQTVEIDGKTYTLTVFYKRINGLYMSIPYKEPKEYVIERRPGYRTVFDYFPGKEFITRYENHCYVLSDPETGLRICDIGWRIRDMQYALDKFMEDDVLCILSHFPEGNVSYDEKIERFIEESKERFGKSLTEAIDEFLENEYKQQKERAAMSKDSNNTIIIGKIAYIPDMKTFLHQGYKVYTIVDKPIHRIENSIGQKFFEDMQRNDCVSWGTDANGDHFVEYIYQAPSEYEDMVITTFDALALLRSYIKVDIECQMDELQQDYAAVENAQLIGG